MDWPRVDAQLYPVGAKPGQGIFERGSVPLAYVDAFDPQNGLVLGHTQQRSIVSLRERCADQTFDSPQFPSISANQMFMQ